MLTAWRNCLCSIFLTWRWYDCEGEPVADFRYCRDIQGVQHNSLDKNFISNLWVIFFGSKGIIHPISRDKHTYTPTPLNSIVSIIVLTLTPWRKGIKSFCDMAISAQYSNFSSFFSPFNRSSMISYCSLTGLNYHGLTGKWPPKVKTACYPEWKGDWVDWSCTRRPHKDHWGPIKGYRL